MKFISPLVEKAYYFAKDAHKGQKRKNGTDYFDNHVKHVYEWLLSHYKFYIPSSCFFGRNSYYQDVALSSALLHDVVEDKDHTGVDEFDIQVEFGKEIKDIVMVLTRKPGQVYFDYVTAIKQFGTLAIAVKLCDLEVNMACCSEKEKTGSRYSKYLFSKHYLLS
jgi:(p)ppGpp synthase/HD superfamily hydrolase